MMNPSSIPKDNGSKAGATSGIIATIVLLILIVAGIWFCLDEPDEGGALLQENRSAQTEGAQKKVTVDRSTPEKGLQTLQMAVAALDKKIVRECFAADEICEILIPNEVFISSSASFMYSLKDTVRSGNFARMDIYGYLHWANTTKNMSVSIYMKQNAGQWSIVDVRQEKRLTSSPEYLEANTVYVLSDSTGTQYFSKMDNYELKYGALMTYSVGPYFGFAEDRAVVIPIPQIDRANGDLLVTTRPTTSYSLYKVRYVKYCYPYSYFNSTSKSWSHGYLKNVDCYDDIADVEGKVISVLADIPEAAKGHSVTACDLGMWRGSVLVSDSPVELDIGCYDGTRYYETKLPITSLLYRMEDEIQCAVQKTKNGYFVIRFVKGCFAVKYTFLINSRLTCPSVLYTI